MAEVYGKGGQEAYGRAQFTLDSIWAGALLDWENTTTSTDTQERRKENQG
jgi:hypothetical protein